MLEAELIGFDPSTNMHINTVVNLHSDNNASFDNDPNNGGNDFFLDFVDEVRRKGKSGFASGLTVSDEKGADPADWIGNTDFNRFQVKVSDDPRDKGGIVRTGAHEVAHGLGLWHPSSPENDIKNFEDENLMFISLNQLTHKVRGSGLNLHPQQMKKIIGVVKGTIPNKKGRFNKRTNFIESGLKDYEDAKERGVVKDEKSKNDG